MNRSLVILAILVVATSVADAQNWNADHDRLVQAVRQKRFEEALNLATDMLGTYREAQFVRDIYTHRVAALRELKRWDAIVAEAGELEKAHFAADRQRLADLYVRFAGALRRGKQPQKAVQVYRLVISRCPKQAAACATARLAIADCYRYDVKDAVKQAIAEYLAVEKEYPAETQTVATAIQRLGDTWWGLKDYRKAKDAYHKAVHRYRECYRPNQVSQYAVRIGEACDRLKEPENARRAYREAEEKFADRDVTRSDLAWRQAKILFDQKRYAEAATGYQRVLARYALANEWRSANAAQSLVDCFVPQRKLNDALKAAHVVYDWGNRHWAVPKIIELLKQLDGNDQRADTFVLFQLYGPKGKDGKDALPDVLAAIGYPEYGAAIQKDFEASLTSLGDDWQGLRRKGKLCLLRGRPREAIPHLYQALLRGPTQQTQSLGVDLVDKAVTALYGTEVNRKPFYRYLRYGAEGKDVAPGVAELLPRPRRTKDNSAKLTEGIAALESFIGEPFAPGVNRRNEAGRRFVMLKAYLRLATERGREDQCVRFCRSVLTRQHLRELQAECVRLASRVLRLRDGHLADEFRFLEETADPKKSPKITPAARNAARQELGRLSRVNAWQKPHKIDFYRRFLPRKKRKGK